jgi:hypothetical protein
MYPYLKAKHDADEKLIRSDLNFTIFRAGKLSDRDEKGKIKADGHLNEKGIISRGDVAETLIEALECESTYRKVVEIIEGDVPIHEALNNLN